MKIDMERILALGKGLVVSYIITGFLMALTAVLMLKMDLSSLGLTVAVIAIYLLSTVAGGFIVGKKVEKRRFLWGLLLGVMYCAILIIISLIAGRETAMQGEGKIRVALLCMLGGMFGGMVS